MEKEILTKLDRIVAVMDTVDLLVRVVLVSATIVLVILLVLAIVQAMRED